jgi:hypothetical protein
MTEINSSGFSKKEEMILPVAEPLLFLISTESLFAVINEISEPPKKAVSNKKKSMDTISIWPKIGIIGFLWYSYDDLQEFHKWLKMSDYPI